VVNVKNGKPAESGQQRQQLIELMKKVQHFNHSTGTAPYSSINAAPQRFQNSAFPAPPILNPEKNRPAPPSISDRRSVKTSNQFSLGKFPELYFRPNPFYIVREPSRRIPPLLDIKEENRVKSETEDVRPSQDEEEQGYEYFRAYDSSSQMKDENDRSHSIQEIENSEAGSKPKEYKDIQSQIRSLLTQNPLIQNMKKREENESYRDNFSHSYENGNSDSRIVPSKRTFCRKPVGRFQGFRGGISNQ
jgi:hypothetical protein